MTREALLALLAEHGEDYDRDCQRHDGCTCGGVPVSKTAEAYYADGQYERTQQAYFEHVADLLVAVQP